LQGLDPRLQTKGGAILALEDVFVLGDEGQQASLSLWQ
jgi:hypothetical protein